MFGSRLQLLAPIRIIGGRPFTLRAEVTCSRALAVTSIELLVSGRQYSDPVHYEGGVLWSRRVRLTGRRRLDVGTHAFEGVFTLPVDPPPTYVGTSFSISWQAHLVVCRPWWFASTRTFGLNVEPDPARIQPPPRSQGVWSSRPEGPAPRAPHAEISLGSTTLTPGGVLQGALAVSNTEFNQYRRLEIRLVAVERGATQSGRIVKRWHLPLDRPGENEPLPFYFRLPDTLRPAFRFRYLSVFWQLEFTVDVAWKSDPTLAIPVAVLPREFSPDPALHDAPLAVGADRIAFVWQLAAERSEFRYDGSRLVREHEGVTAELRLEDRRRQGQVVVGEIRYADLCVGLSWDEIKGLQADDPELGTGLNDRLGPHLRATSPERVDDRMIVVKWRDISRSIDPMVAACSLLDGLARNLQQLIAELPPPQDVDDLELARWRGEARRLGARFHPSAMRIAGQAQGRSYRLATRWSATADRARRRVGLEVVLEPGRDDPEGVRESFDLDAFDDALACLQRALAEASPARSLYR